MKKVSLKRKTDKLQKYTKTLLKKLSQFIRFETLDTN